MSIATEAAPSPILDNTEPWVAGQIEEYIATDGAKPEFTGGAALLLLTTQGRTTGQWRRTCLIYGEDGADLVIVASLGGAPKHPVWFLNLKANERVWLQVGAESFWAVATEAGDADRERLWPKMVEVFPDYAAYQERTERRIPLVILHREN
jgi:deazaflavin-dependent oxidoreductase (nitroreductase family)